MLVLPEASNYPVASRNASNTVVTVMVLAPVSPSSCTTSRVPQKIKILLFDHPNFIVCLGRQDKSE